MPLPSVAVPWFENNAHPIEAARQTLNIPTRHPPFTRPCAAMPSPSCTSRYARTVTSLLYCLMGFGAIACWLQLFGAICSAGNPGDTPVERKKKKRVFQSLV
ncbi:hypothetical protein V8C34DRAFT_289797 [Trichoderma compactum]